MNGLSSTDDMVITWVANLPPTANNQNLSTNENTALPITLTATDPENDPLTYSVVSQPAHGTVSPTTGQNVTYTPQTGYFGPDSFTFKANDGHNDSNIATISITVNHVNRPPVANAGPNQTVVEQSLVHLNGSASSDPDGDPLTFSWAQTPAAGEPIVTLSGANTATPTFTAPAVSNTTTLHFQLTVTDPGNLSSSASVAITVLHFDPSDHPPTVNAGADQDVPEGTAVALTATGSDPDNDPLTYQWSQIGGPVVPLANANTQQAGFTAPDVSATTLFTFRVTASDGRGGIANDDVIITVRDVGATQIQIPLLSDVMLFPSPYNPKKGALTIRYQLRGPSDVTAVISDLFGRRVKELTASANASGGQAGGNDILWDGKNGEGDDVSNGAYIVQIQAREEGTGATAKSTQRVGVRR
ncbi:MAG: cadherin-like domain-containing protein [Elusimicrobia bacterium]|nr:cadherin-like domain-containing protein [Elusimicrobiota bacterium]